MLVSMRQKGRFEDGKVVYDYVEGHDVEKTGMSLDEMVSKEGKDSDGNSCTPLQWQQRMNSWRSSSTSSRVVLQWTSLDRRIVMVGIVYIMLHGDSKKNVQMLQWLIDNYNGDIKQIINQKNNDGDTPLDYAYEYNDSPIKNDIVSLLA